MKGSIHQRARNWIAASTYGKAVTRIVDNVESAKLSDVVQGAMEQAYVAGFKSGQHYPLTEPNPNSNRSKKARGQR